MYAKEYAKFKANEQKNYQCNLYMILEALQSEVVLGEENEILAASSQHVHADIDSFLTQEVEKSLFLCRIDWMEKRRKTQYHGTYCYHQR